MSIVPFAVVTERPYMRFSLIFEPYSVYASLADKFGEDGEGLLYLLTKYCHCGIMCEV